MNNNQNKYNNSGNLDIYNGRIIKSTLDIGCENILYKTSQVLIFPSKHALDVKP